MASIHVRALAFFGSGRTVLGMLILVLVLLTLWLIVSIVGFAIKGLIWLAFIGIVLFLATALIGLVRRASNRATRRVEESPRS